MQHLSLLIKPASSLCNLRCKYCFYHDVAGNRNIMSFGIMNEKTMRNIIDKAFEYVTESVAFMFQGGEPTLAGLDYFIKFTDYANRVKKNCNKKINVNYSIQTNGMSIDEDFAKFLHDNNFLVGLSLDGTKEIHDYLRGEDSHKKVMKTAAILTKSNVEFNILCVVGSHLAKHIEKSYKFFRKQGFAYLQFIPCLDPLDKQPFADEYSLSPQLYEYYLKTLFSLWYNDFMADEYISIRYFDNLVRLYSGTPSEQCGMNGHCDGQTVIESDGSTYPCDFYCLENWKTGDINTMSYSEISQSEAMKKFIATSYYDAEKCEKCEYFYLCKGGCRRNRDLTTDGRALDNIYCEALYNFYGYAEPFLKDIVRRLTMINQKRQRQQ